MNIRNIVVVAGFLVGSMASGVQALTLNGGLTYHQQPGLCQPPTPEECGKAQNESDKLWHQLQDEHCLFNQAGGGYGGAYCNGLVFGPNGYNHWMDILAACDPKNKGTGKGVAPNEGPCGSIEPTPSHFDLDL